MISDFPQLTSKLANVGQLKYELADLLNYIAKSDLGPTLPRTSYRDTWRVLFRLQQSGVVYIPNVLLMAELCFVLPLSNARVESFFSKMRFVESDWRASLNNGTLCSLLRITADGPEYGQHDSVRAIHLYRNTGVRRRPGQPKNRNQQPGKPTTEQKKRKLVQSGLKELYAKK